jgi:hypothetical protein
MPASDGGDDFIGVCGPDEGFRVVVGFGKKWVDGGLEIDERSEHTALQATLSQLGEEALGGIKPRC